MPTTRVLGICASPGSIGTARGQRDIRNTFTFLDGRVMNQPEVMVPSPYDKVEDGKVTDEKTREFVAMAIQAFGKRIDLHKAGA